MSQDFHGGVGQAASGDINNYGININVADRAEARGLVSAQRKELHELRAKCEELGEDPRDIWRMVHAQLGVKSISEISADQFAEARCVMRARLEQLQEEADMRRLVGKVLRAVTEKDVRAEMNNFCELSFGRVKLNNLKKFQLQKTLEFVQQIEIVTQPSTPPSEPETTSIQSFLIAHRQSAAVLFFFGVLVGGVWF